MRWDDDDAVAVADNDVARIDGHTAAADRQIQVAGMMHDRARRRGGPPMVGGQAGLENALSVAQSAVGNDPCAAASFEPSNIEITRRCRTRIAARIYDQHVAWRAGLHRLALDIHACRGAGAVLVLACWDETQGEGDPDYARSVRADRSYIVHEHAA